jgi:hypothetical protein
MIAFIDEHRALHGVEPICRVLPIAPSTYHTHAARRADPGKLPARAQRDITLTAEIRRVYEENFHVYGIRKVWRQLLREGTAVARCTGARLMRTMGLQGVVRGKRVRTTISNAAVPCPLDRVNRQFNAPRPNALWVSDFTYVATWAGFVYVAFVIDVLRGVSSAGVSRARLMPASCWTRWSKPYTSAGPSGAAASSTTVIAVCNTSRSNIPSGLPRQGSSLRSAASVTATTMPSPKPSTASTKPR